MTQITVQDGKVVVRDGKVGTGEGCCCGGGECDCEACAVTVTVEVETETIEVTTNDVWSDSVQLCLDLGGQNTSSNGRQARAKSYCENGNVKVVVELTWQAAGYCARGLFYSYSFDTCGADGCPTGEATLVSTTDTGELDDIFGTCADPFVNRSCSTITAPSSITANPLP